MSQLSKAIELLEQSSEVNPKGTIDSVVEFLLGDTYFAKENMSRYNKKELILFAKRLELENEY